jgi:hypothetical protein
MNDFIIQGSEPVIKIDSLGIGINTEIDIRDVDRLNLNDKEYLIVGDSQGTLDYSNNLLYTKHNLYVNHQGVAINTNRYDMSNFRDPNASLFVNRNIQCDGVISATGFQFKDITFQSTITDSKIDDLFRALNVNEQLQPFKAGISTYFDYKNGYGYDVNNIYSPNYITLGGHVDTHNNRHPLHINSTPNNDFNNIHLAIRNDTRSIGYIDSVKENDNLSKLSIGIIGGSNISPAVIATTTGMPLEFHVSKNASDINSLYNKYALPKYSGDDDFRHPAMAIDRQGTVCIGKDKSSLIDYTVPRYESGILNRNFPSPNHICKLDVNGPSKFHDIIIKDNRTGFYKHIDNIYLRADDLGDIEPSQIKEGEFLGNNYKFRNILEAKTLITENITNAKTLNTSNVITEYITIGRIANFEGGANFTNDNGIFTKKITVESDLLIDGKRINPIDINDLTRGYTTHTQENGSNFFFTYVHSNIATLDFQGNVSFPNKMCVGNADTSGILNVKKNRESSNIFEVVLKTEEYTANIGRISYTGFNDNSLIINTNNNLYGIKNNIYFYPSYDIENLRTNPLDAPALSITNKGISINKKIPDANLHLDINGKISATEYYLTKNNLISRISGFVENTGKDFFNIFNENSYKYCINYNTDSLNSHEMRGLNVKYGINSDAYYINNKLIGTLQSTPKLDGFYTNNKIAIGWNSEDTLKVPLHIRNTTTEDYNNSVIRIYRGIHGGGSFNDAGFSGIDICEYERDGGDDRNLERWFIYKNHRISDKNARDVNGIKIGPLQFGYTDKTIEPTTFAMSMYYNSNYANYHTDFNNPNVHKKLTDIPNTAVSIYGDLEVHGNIKIIDKNSCNFQFIINKLQNLSYYQNTLLPNPNTPGSIYNIDTNINNSEDIEYSGKNIILKPIESIIVDSINTANTKIPFIVKQNKENLSVAKFITYSNNIPASSAFELCIHKQNSYTTADDNSPANIKNKVEFKIANENDNNTNLKLSYYKDETYKPFVEFNNINTKTYMRLGQNSTNNFSNISLHIANDNKNSIQITNTNEPIRINMVNTYGGSNKYTVLSSGNRDTYYNFNIGVANKAVTQGTNDIYDNELKNIFTISPYTNDYIMRKGAKFGFNEPFNEPNSSRQTVVINSEYDKEPVIITGRYTQDNIYTDITYYTSNLNLTIPNRRYSSNFYDISSENIKKEYKSDFVYNIQNLGNKDIHGSNVVITNNSIVYKTLHDFRNISYTSIHSNISLSFTFLSDSRTNIEKVNNYQVVSREISAKNYDVTFNDPLGANVLFNIDLSLSYGSNQIINRNEKIKTNEVKNLVPPTFNMSLVNAGETPAPEITLNYKYYNTYKIPLYLDTINTSNATIFTSNIRAYVNNNINSNFITFNNTIYTYFRDESTQIGQTPTIQNTYKNRLYVNDSTDFIGTVSQTQVFLETKTSNIFYYDPTYVYSGNFDIHRNNNFNIYSSNIIPNTRTNSNYYIALTYSNVRIDYYDKMTSISTSITNSSNIFDITTSNIYSESSRYASEIVQSPTVVMSDDFLIEIENLPAIPLNNTIRITEYYKKYRTNDNDKIDIQLTNYNKKNFNPQIILANKVENELIERNDKRHNIYSYDGDFKITYEDSTIENEVFFIGSDGTLNIKGDIKKNGVDYLSGVNGDIVVKIEYIENKIITEANNTSNYILSTSNILVPRILTEIGYTSNYVTETSNILVPRILTEINVTSNIISQRITELTTDMINELPNANNRFIINNIYNSNLTINGDFTVNSNLIVRGNTTHLETIVYTTDNLEVVNINDTSVALMVQQQNSTTPYDIFVASNHNTKVFNLANDGTVNIIGNYKRNNRDVIEDTSNYVTVTSNIFVSSINDTSNYIVETSNFLNQYINSRTPWKVINNNKISYHSNVIVDGIIWCKQVRLIPANNIMIDNEEISRDAIGDTSNYVTVTSNVFVGRINDASNYIVSTSNNLSRLLNENKSPWNIIDNNNILYTSNVKVGADLRVEGDVYCREVMVSSSISDDRLKDYTSNIRNPIDLINKLNGFHYVPNNLAQQYGFKKINEIGLSAQEVQIILPEIVKPAPFDMMHDDYNNLISKTGENYLTISYEKMAPLFVESIKELKKEINELRLEIAELRNANK